MISISRCAAPACLTDAPSESSRYKKGQVVEALWRMQHGKCCYSEISIPGTGHGKAVEHFRPQAEFSWLRNEWINLLLVCPQCNGKKSNHFPVMLTANANETKVVFNNPTAEGDAAIIDPSDDSVDPETHLSYVIDDDDPLYGQIIAKDGSALGQTTIDVTGIGEEFFVRERRKRLLYILEEKYHMILREKLLGCEDTLQIQLDQFERFLQSDQEFAGLSREFARQHKFVERFGIAIPNS